MLQIEKEARFYFPSEKLEELKKKIIELGAQYAGTSHQLTIMYDNPNPDFTFYTEAIDGRLRVRIIQGIDEEDNVQKDSILVSWNRRVNYAGGIGAAEENEFHVNYNEKEQLIYLIENVLKCPRVSSYERNRARFELGKLAITVDEFPFGCMLEVEIIDGSDEEIIEFVEKAGLEFKNISKLSCDDKYFELCERAGKEIKKDIAFNDKDMPKIE